MKRIFVAGVLVLMTSWRLAAQDAASVAAKEASDERYERMSADIQALQAANTALQNKISEIEQQISDMRSAQSQAANSNNSSVQDDLKRLAAKIEEVDRKREDDKQAISDEIHKSIGQLEKMIAQQSRSAPPRVLDEANTGGTGAPPASADKGFVYTVQEGDTLSAIVGAYNKDFKSKGMKTITLSQAMDANPKVDWNRLRVGQKIVIPQPQ